jgi:predicted ATPase
VAAGAVASDADGTKLLELLASLLDRSLVQGLPDMGETRFAIPRMIREYALARLEQAGELSATRARLAAYLRWPPVRIQAA